MTYRHREAIKLYPGTKGACILAPSTSSDDDGVDFELSEIAGDIVEKTLEKTGLKTWADNFSSYHEAEGSSKKKKDCRIQKMMNRVISHQ